jgi:hypothetical protein
VVSQCANPGCKAPFIYLREGRLFAVPRHNAARKIEYFWLCGSCSTQMELEFGLPDLVPVIVPRPGRDEFALGAD